MESSPRDSGMHEVWLVTGAGRGMGADIARAALGAGHAVVATGRDPDEVADELGESDAVLPARLDVTSPVEAGLAVDAAVDRFGRIDVVVNNAGISYEGFFEEMPSEHVDQQLAVNLRGPMNVTRAVLPVMRAQGSGWLVMISSGAGLIGFAFSSVYAAAKAGLEGWTTALADEVAPFGITTTIVNPGFFRTELISERAMTYAPASIADYDDRRDVQQQWWQGQAGRQPGDPARLAGALVTLASEDPPPRRFLAGADALALAELKADELRAQADAYRQLSAYMAHEG